MKTGYKALWNYQGLIIDMGVKPDKKGKPTFYIMTDEYEQIQVTIDNGINIAMIRDWLNNLNTVVKCSFEDYGQFSAVVEEIFKIYASRQGQFLNYDNTYLNLRKQQLKVSDKTISKYAGVGKSTVNDLTRGLTKHPRFYTVCKIHSALRKIANINGNWD